MKCSSCNGEISPTFVAAIESNNCPICGKGILATEEHTAIRCINAVLSKEDIRNDSGMPLGLSAKIYTSLSSKFFLVPKEESDIPKPTSSESSSPPTLSNDIIPENKPKVKPIKRVNEFADESVIKENIKKRSKPEDDLEDEFAHLSENEKEEIRREFGLDVGAKENFSSASIDKKPPADPALNSLFDGMKLENGDEVDPKITDRLQRARKTKSSFKRLKG